MKSSFLMPIDFPKILRRPVKRVCGIHNGFCTGASQVKIYLKDHIEKEIFEYCFIEKVHKEQPHY